MRSVGRVTQLERCDEATLNEAVRDCDALLVRTYSKVTAGVLAGATRLKVIGRGGVGLEKIDLDAARAAERPVRAWRAVAIADSRLPGGGGRASRRGGWTWTVRGP
ncbi:MAG: hypothetical protein HY763_17130 [Planctomycetes bacterium]|nr:hypothetical protein [Planctomycetota bacterium]